MLLGYNSLFGYKKRIKPKDEEPQEPSGIDLTGFDLLFADSFEREGDTITTLLSDGAGTGVLSAPWSTVEGSWERDAGGIYLDETVDAWYWALSDTGESNVVLQSNIKIGEDDMGFALRFDPNTGNGFFVVVDQGDFLVRKVQNWSPSSVGTYYGDLIEPGTEINFKVIASGSTIEVYVDGELVVTVTDSFNQNVTTHGLFSSIADTSARWDNILFTDIVENPLDIPGEYWTAEYPSHAHSVTISDSIYSDGSKSLRVEIRKTDDEVSDSKRCELSGVAETPLEEHWYFLDIYLPGEGDEEYLLDPAPEILTQWHNVPDDGEPWTTPPLALWTMNGKYYINRRWDEDSMTSDEKMENEGKTAWHDLGSYLGDKGKWVTWAFRVKWGWLEEQNPMLEVYKDGEKVLDCNGLPNMTNDQSGIYWKIGLYKWDWADPESESVLNTRVVYFDNVKNYLKSSLPIHIIGTRNFYVANDGNDNADGSISTPWATLAKVNSTEFVPGDVIHFKCGDTWRGQLLPGYEGSAEGHVIYSSYGKGSKPLILGSVSKSSTGDWTKVSGNIWRASGLTVDVGNIILNHGAACGVKKYTSGALANQNDFWYDAANDQVRMYSVGNPASLYSSIELALVQNIVDLPLNEYTPKSHIMVHNLALKYGGAHGVWGAWSNDIILKDLDISWIGGGYLYDDVRYGNGIEFYDGLDGPVTIENCTIQQVFDAAVTFQSDNEWGDFKNVTIKDNIIRNVSWSFEYWNHESGTTENILFQGNRCYGAGINWAASQKADPSGMHVNIQWNATNSSNIKILDNIFDRATDLHVYVAEDTPNLAAFELANNIYRQPAAEVPAWGLFDYDGTGYSFEAYKTASGKDADSTYEEY